MENHVCSVVIKHRSTMQQRVTLFGLISCITLVFGGCFSKPDLYFPTSTVLEPGQKVEQSKATSLELLKPRTIEEWADPDDQELARSLLAIDEQRRILRSQVEKLWDTRRNRSKRWLRLVGQFSPVHKWHLADC